MKLDKVLCCMFLFRFFGLDGAQNTIVVYSALRNQPIEMCWLCNSCIVYERKTKVCALSGLSDINLGIFVYSFDVCWASQPVPSINYGQVGWILALFIFLRVYGPRLHLGL